jgi:hypothetical protein
MEEADHRSVRDVESEEPDEEEEENSEQLPRNTVVSLFCRDCWVRNSCRLAIGCLITHNPFTDPGEAAAGDQVQRVRYRTVHLAQVNAPFYLSLPAKPKQLNFTTLHL